MIEERRKVLPELPDSRKARFIEKYGLPSYDADLLVSDITYAEYFEEALKNHNSPKLISNWIMSELLRVLNDKNCAISDVGISPASLATLVKLIEDGLISGKQGKEVFNDAVSTGKNPADIVKEKGMAQVSDTGKLELMLKKVIEANPAEAERYRNGEIKLQGFFVGQIMKVSQGKANPKLVNELLKKLLS
jgi:aspartyl-tRNA(Asn)/glutamyl-tRNA(Gln) amidotransferase subunit B